MKRQIPCNFCTGEVLSEQNGRTTSSASLFPRVQNLLVSISDTLKLITGNTKTVDRKTAIGGKCEACGGKGSYDDPSDTSDKDKAAAEHLKKNIDKIDELSAKLGHSPGGSRLTRIAGAEVLLVGHEFNGAPSYDVVKNVPGPGNKVTKGAGRAAVDAGTTEHTQVNGNNVPANSGGGHYIIRCSNRFQLAVGSQGINIKTSGPLEIDGGIVHFTGAEVLVGSKNQTTISGNHLVLDGKNISITPTGASKQVGVNGSLAVTGNIQSGGAYIDNLYVSKITCPSKQISTKASSQGSIITGPPAWGGTNQEALKLAIKDLIKNISDSSADPNLFSTCGAITPKGILKLADNMTNLIYSGIPVETKPTGIAIVTALGVGGGLIYNYPHVHVLPDDPHTHDVKVPATNHENHETADTVRAAFDSAGGNTGVPCAGSTDGNFLGKLWGSLGNVVKATQALFSTTGYHDALTSED
jgi:hypothetical protein